jgi:hypothetical protein
MRRVGIPQAALIVCIVGAAAVTLTFRNQYGFAFSAGLVVGGLNSVATLRTFEATLAFRSASLFRLGLVSALVFGVALAIGQQALLPFALLGLAASQMLLVAVATREVLSR